MDQIKYTDEAYEYFKIAKQMESFADRSHYLEKEINRAMDLVQIISEKLVAEGRMAEEIYTIPEMFDSICTDIHHDYNSLFMRTVGIIRPDGSWEWPCPLNPSVGQRHDIPGAEAILDGLSTLQAVRLVRVMLMDLSEEIAQMEEEHRVMLDSYGDSDKRRVASLFNQLRKEEERHREYFLAKAKDAEEKVSDEQEREQYKFLYELMALSPFAQAKQLIDEQFLESIDAVLASYEE